MRKLLCLFALAASLSIAGPVSYYGALTVDGKYIKDKNKSQTVQLKGPSLYWSDGNGLSFYNSGTVDWFVDTMDISVIRYAMAVQYMKSDGSATDLGASDGYLISENNKISQKERIETMVQAAIRNDIYIIIDWHSHRAQNEQTEAVAFFKEMAIKYRGIPNVIFEIYNEPPSNVSWSSISGYMDAVIRAIRNDAQNNNLILVGSPSWSSNPNDASAGGSNSLHQKYVNIAYTMHFYAATHKTGGSQHSNSNTAMNNGAAVFVSEWGTTAASGSGTPDESSTNSWTAWMDNNKISSCNWSVSNFEASSIFTNNSSYSVNALSASGKLFYKYMGGNGTTTLGKTNPPSGWPWARSRTLTLKEGETKNWTAAELELSSGASFERAEASDGTASATASQLTFTVPQESQNMVIYINYWVNQGGNSSKHRITVNVNRGPRISVSELAVSKTAVSKLTYTKLGITHPSNSKLSFASQSVSGGGTISRSSNNDTLIYTPPANATEGQIETLTYTVKDAQGNSVDKTVTLTLKNVAPTAGNQSATIQNTAPYTFSLDFNATPPVGDKLLPGRDDDGDPIWVYAAWLEEGWPGTVSISSDKRSITYTPEPNKISGGKPVVHYTLTDGKNISAEGHLTYTIRGEGSNIPTPITKTILAGNFALMLRGTSLSVEFSKSGFASLDIYSISGKKTSLMNGYQNAGSQEFNISNLQKGVYIVRLKQGSEVKVQRVIIK